MKKYVFIVLMGCIAVSSCNDLTGTSVYGEGDLVTRQHDVGNFDKVENSGPFDVIITNEASNKVKVEAEQNLQEYIQVGVENNTLIIRPKKHYNIHSPHTVKIIVSAPSLRALRLYGSGNIRTEDRIPSPGDLEIKSAGSGDIIYNLKAESLTAQILGSGNMTLTGTANDLDANIKGSGNIQAKELETNKTDIHIYGSGNVDIRVKENLNVKIYGSGGVNYWGSPSVDKEIAGSGSVSKAD